MAAYLVMEVQGWLSLNTLIITKMFDKLKDLKKLKDLENALGKEMLEKEKDGIKVVVNGRAEIISILLNNDLGKEKQEEVLKEVINDVSREAKMLMARKASEITGFGF